MKFDFFVFFLMVHYERMEFLIKSEF